MPSTVDLTKRRAPWPHTPLGYRRRLAVAVGWVIGLIAVWIAVDVTGPVPRPEDFSALTMACLAWGACTAFSMSIAVAVGAMDVVPRQEFELCGRHSANAARRAWVPLWFTAGCLMSESVVAGPYAPVSFPGPWLGVPIGLVLTLTLASIGWPAGLMPASYRAFGPHRYRATIPARPNPIRERLDARYAARREREQAAMGPIAEPRPWPYTPLGAKRWVRFWLSALAVTGFAAAVAAAVAPADEVLDRAALCAGAVVFLWVAIGPLAGWFDVIADDAGETRARLINALFIRPWTPGAAIVGLGLINAAFMEATALGVVVWGLVAFPLVPLYVTLAVAGWPGRLLPPSVRELGPYTVVDPLPEQLPDPTQDRAEQYWKDRQKEKARVRRNARARERRREQREARVAAARKRDAEAARAVPDEATDPPREG